MPKLFRRYYFGLIVVLFRVLFAPSQLSLFAGRIQYTTSVISYPLSRQPKSLKDRCLNSFILKITRMVYTVYPP